VSIIHPLFDAGTNLYSFRERVFILGPSHHIYFQGVAYLSGADEYETPFGNILVDTKVVDDLCKSKVFKKMDMETDEDEHSFEMHAPYIYKMTEGLPQGIPKIIPIMISHGDRAFDDAVSSILAKYLNDETNTFVISSDFCHWGSRFGYTKYTPAESLEYLKSLKHMSRIPIDGLKIYQSIRFLDRYATKVISTGSSSQWKDYIQISGNTICGQHPISLLLQTIEKVRELEGKAQDWALFNWIGYTQSSKVITPDDSSVSYASGYAVTD
jgi:AmmeMemoRadiSam system protein B